MKNIKLLGLVALSLSCISATIAPIKADESFNGYHVYFFNNYLREEFTLSNGTKGKGDNLLYQTVTVEKDALVTKPADPVRKNYEFQGWYLEENCETVWNFETDKVTNNLRLFAKWGVTEEEVEPEPPYNPPSTVLEESASTDYVINSIMYFKVTSNVVRVTRSALLKLDAHKDNVLPLMEYKVKASKTMTAIYASNKILVTCGETFQEITVLDNSAEYVVGNTTYANKAKNYEEKAVEEFEKKHENYKVYHCIRSHTEFGELLSMLYVNGNDEEFEEDKENFDYDIADGYAFAYVKNLTDDWCSEFGSIGIQSVNGGVQRVA